MADFFNQKLLPFSWDKVVFLALDICQHMGCLLSDIGELLCLLHYFFAYPSAL